ncbi:cytochrome c-type biogenesis CcmF C-terminal domain-containing protein [Methanolobus sp. WCC5]|uniref:cytochrome c-type biogenesis CcmF C-terminal domain-containing protein n=1 Tax=Methanolobus sp. WCC5 TaxID=3125785 RepID=UPI00324E2385
MKNKIPLLTTSNTMLATVVTFLLLATIVTIGMLTPLIAKLATGIELSLQPEYFNNRTAIPVAALVLLLSACMLIGYSERRYVLPVVGTSIFLSLLFAILSPFGNIAMDISVPVLIIALAATLYRVGKIYAANKNTATSGKIRKLSAHVIHIGILLILLGIILSSNMKIEGSAVLGTDGTGEFEGQPYQLKIIRMESYYSGEAFRNYPASSYTTEVDFDIYRNGDYFRSGQVKYITDFKWGQTYTTTYINRGLTEELFVAPRAIDESSGEIDLYMRTVPFINCLWGGIYLMAIGIIGLLISDRTSAGRTNNAIKRPRAGAEGRYDRMLEQEIEKRRTQRDKRKR